MVSQSPTMVVGRNRELALARRIVIDLRQSVGTTLLIEGEAGIGKSRLVQWMVDDAGSADITALRGEGHPFERSRPFGVIVDASTSVGVLLIAVAPPSRSLVALGRLPLSPQKVHILALIPHVDTVPYAADVPLSSVGATTSPSTSASALRTCR